MEALGAPFPEDEVEFLPRAQSNGKALGLAYIDARTVMNRLDAVVGPGNWTFDFDVISPDGKMVRGRLTVLGVTKCDAGEASTEEEILKSAVSDALKRCAVHFGIGRYLYYLPRVWAPYDAQKRRFTETPRLDRVAVEKALRICNVGTRPQGRPALRMESAPEPAPRTAPEAAPQTAPAPPVEAPARDAAEEAQEQPRKSIWATGAAGAEAPRSGGDPESSGDRAAAKSTPRASTNEAVPAPLVCSTDGCGKALTKGQHDISVRAYGQPLCPGCQKTHVRAA
jgi:hypothetical protein